MPDIDRWVIRSVFSRYAALSGQMEAPLTCAINLSGTTLNPKAFSISFVSRRRRTTCRQVRSASKFTETAAINNMRNATQFMRAVKSLGFCFALDDFGVGTSSLAY